MTNDEFASYYDQYKGVIAAIARKHARHDEELYKDLKQEGLFALFKLDLSRVRVNEDALIRQAIKFRMIDYLRKLSPESYESLQDRLENGGQVVIDEEGEVTLIMPPSTRGPMPVARRDSDETESRVIKLYEDGPPPREDAD